MRHDALGAHHKWLIASVAEFIFALGAREMHTTASGKCVTELAFGTIDSVNLQMLRHTLVLFVRIVAILPLCVLVACQPLVLLLPL